MKQFKRILSIVLVLSLVFALCACGKGNDGTTTGTKTGSTSTATTSTATTSTATTSQQYQDKPTYVLNFSANDAADSTYDKNILQPLQQLVYDNTKNQLGFDMYYSSTLAGQGACLDGIASGTVDIGVDVLTMYTGTYLYTELIGTPGIDYGTSENFTRLVNEYAGIYKDAALDDFYIVARFCSGLFGFSTVDKPVSKVSDVSGLAFRATGNFIPYLEKMGASGTFIPMSELYEALKLNVVDGAQTTLAGIYSFKYYEVCNYFTPITWFMGDQVIAMSRDVYDDLPADVQQGIDATKASMLDVGIAYTDYAYQEAKDNISKENSKFTYVDVAESDIQGFLDAASGLLDDKAAALDAAGLDGTGALEWLRANCQKYVK